MTIEEWAKDFKSYVNALDMPRDDYNGIMEYIDDALALLKEQETENICYAANARIFACKECGYGVDDIYLTNERNYPIYPVYCPNCGRKVKE